ncbi:DNA fragmentation factor subunit beta isoform X3 [Mirounga angustirostris]|uniref:DNA fragmentation factor subunit beta isoform X3 n=1 Tax=Mirounga angustirostris TaxID=9716 RepID=UPI00313D7637
MWEVSFGDEKGSHLLGWCPLHIRPHITCGAGTRARAQGNGSLVSGQGLGPRASLRLGSSRSEEVLDVREPVLKAGSSVSSRGGPQGLLAFLSVPLLVADVSDISRLLSAFHKPHAGLIQAAQQLLSDEQAPLRQKLLADLLHTVSENIAAETRAEDPPWFEGLESRFRSKSGYLRYSCESRIRSYLREVNSYASVVGVEAQEEYSRIVDVMCRELRAAQYNGSYFDRGAEAGGRLCTSEGWFCCQGPFDMDTCASKHSINPYGNRESRVLFSTWNLDHIDLPMPFKWPYRFWGSDGTERIQDVMGTVEAAVPPLLDPFPSAPRNCSETRGFRAGLWALCALRLGRRPCSLDSCMLVWGVRGPPSEPGRRDSGVSGRRLLSASSVAALERLSPGTWSV